MQLDKVKETAKNLRGVFENFLKSNEILLTDKLLEDARNVVSQIRPDINGRKSPTGLPLDYYAPSIWHAASYLQFTYLMNRLKMFDISQIHKNFEECNFGSIIIFRGQTLPWKIIPTNWRFTNHSDIKISEIQNEIFREYVSDYMLPEDAIELDLFGRLNSPNKINGLAQHYGLKTNFVDFTFDPLVALYFASQDVNISASFEIERKGIVYFTSFLKACMVGKVDYATPPIQATRLFRQSGFFVDYGRPPDKIKQEIDYSEQWMYLQQNCGRILFDRTYPNISDEDKIFFDEYILSPNPFFEELVTNIKKIDLAEKYDKETVKAWLRNNCKQRPSWRVKSLDKSFVYTDDELFEVGAVLERYLKTASMILMKNEPLFDPLVTNKFSEADKSIYTSIKEINNLPYGGVFDSTCGIILKTIKLLSSLRDE